MAAESYQRSEPLPHEYGVTEASHKVDQHSPSLQRRGVPLRTVERPISDPMNPKGKAPPAMSYGQLTKDRAQILWDMTCEDEEREKFETQLRHWKEQLELLPQTEQTKQREVKQWISDIYIKMQAQLGSNEECRQRQEFRENQLQYIDQLLREGKLQQPDVSAGGSEVRSYAVDNQRERPVKIHRSNTTGESHSRDSRRLQPTSSGGVPGKLAARQRQTPNRNGVHIRQRSNPEQGRLVHEMFMRSRVDPAASVGDLPASFPFLGSTRRSSRSPGHSSEHLDSSTTSINSFNLQARPGSNTSLHSLDRLYPHKLVSTDDSYLSSSTHRELSQYDESSLPSMVVSSVESLSSRHSHSSSTDLNDLRGEFSPRYGDQKLVAAASPNPTPHLLSSHISSLTSNGSLSSKVEMIQSLLTMLRPSDHDEMSRTLLAMANSKESCVAMRQSGCIPLLLQILHPRGKDGVAVRVSREAKMRATAALHNIIHLQGHSHEAVREMNVLRLLEQVRTLTDVRRLQAEKASNQQNIPLTSANMKLMAEHQRPGHGVESLMHLSFKTEYRQAILLLGGMFAVSELLEADHKASAISGITRDDSDINRIHPGIDVRKHCCMILTNLTFGGDSVKTELCRMINCLHVIVLQLESPAQELVHAAGNILRNLSWNADESTKQALRSCGAIRGLIRAASRIRDEATLRALTSALWNMSAHFKENKSEICSEPGGLRLILHLLRHWTSAKYPEDIVQNAAGILLNVSSYVSSREAYRQRLRDSGLYEVLVELLKSGSQQMLKKVCGIVWNLSSRNPSDQARLWELGAVPALYRLTASIPDPEIRTAAAQALKNLMHSKGSGQTLGTVAEVTGKGKMRKMRREPGVGMDASLLQPSQSTVPAVSGNVTGSRSQVSKPPPKPKRLMVNPSVESGDFDISHHQGGTATPPQTGGSKPNSAPQSRSHSRSQSMERQPQIVQVSKSAGSGLSSESDRLSTTSSSSTGSGAHERQRQRSGSKQEANGGPTLETQL